MAQGLSVCGSCRGHKFSSQHLYWLYQIWQRLKLCSKRSYAVFESLLLPTSIFSPSPTACTQIKGLCIHQHRVIESCSNIRTESRLNMGKYQKLEKLRKSLTQNAEETQVLPHYTQTSNIKDKLWYNPERKYITPSEKSNLVMFTTETMHLSLRRGKRVNISTCQIKTDNPQFYIKEISHNIPSWKKDMRIWLIHIYAKKNSQKKVSK